MKKVNKIIHTIINNKTKLFQADETENLKLNLSLIELRRLYDKYDHDNEHIDSKAISLLSSSGLIVTILSILLTQKWFDSGVTKTFLIITLFVFMILILMILLSLMPRRYRTLFICSEEGLDRMIFNHEKSGDALRTVISNYIHRIQYNENLNVVKARFLLVSNILFTISIILLCIMLLHILFN
jgi:hypothetical protein